MTPPSSYSDAFLTKLDPQGAALTYSTFLGGSSVESIQAITLGADGTVHATGETHSSDFPTTPGAYDRTQNGQSDAFVSALNATGTDLIYSTYLGAGDHDVGYGIVLGPGDTAYVTGVAQSDDFPTTPGAYDETFNGGNNDLFVTRLDAQGGSLVFSTYVGGNDHDDGEAIALDPAGNVYVVGDTNSPNYPTTPGAYDRTINSNIYSDAFVTKLNPTGSALVYSTFLGGDAYRHRSGPAAGRRRDPDPHRARVLGQLPHHPGSIRPCPGRLGGRLRGPVRPHRQLAPVQHVPGGDPPGH